MPAQADGTLTSPRVPPDPTPDQVESRRARSRQSAEQADHRRLRGAARGRHGTAAVAGGVAGDPAGRREGRRSGARPGRHGAHRRADLWRARRAGGRSFALNEMLRRYQAQLDSAYDFRVLVLPVGSGQTLMRPPIVSAAQMAFALGDSGQVARETSCIYQITREAQLASAPPNWRTYLVRVWARPHRPSGRLPCRAPSRRPPTGTSGWRRAGRRARSRRSRSSCPIWAGLSAISSAWPATACCCGPGLVEQPRVAFQNAAVQGGRDSLHVGDATIRITDQPGLQGQSAPLARRGMPAMSAAQ